MPRQRISPGTRCHGRRVAALAAVACAIAGLLSFGAGSASARGLVTGLTDGLYQSPDPATRATWLDRTNQEDAGIVRLNVLWRAVAPSRPANPRDPADPAYNFGSLDAAVTDATNQGLKVMLTVYTAPDWAEGKNPPSRDPAGTWKPNPTAYGDFGHALAQRYSGGYVGPTGTLPRVRYFEAWNEPNLCFYLNPQWKQGKPASPTRYRQLLNAFYGGVKQAQPGAKVIGGANAPSGDPPGGCRMRPVLFMRKMFCLGAKHCSGGVPHLDILSDHPITSPNITTKNAPTTHAANKQDIFVADFYKVRKILKAAERSKHIRPGGHHPLWATEFWWLTHPPNPPDFAVSPAKQAKWIEETLYLLWNQGASVAINLQIKDVKDFGSGTFTTDAKKKPSFRTFRFPFVTHHGKSKHTIGVWGKSPVAGKLQIQRRRNGGWRTIKTLNVSRGQVFTTKVHVPRSATLRGKVGGTTSAPWGQKSSGKAAVQAQGASKLGPTTAPPSVAPYVESAR